MPENRNHHATAHQERRYTAGGFAALLGLMVLVMALGHSHMRSVRERMEAVVHEHNARADTLFSMRNLVRERSLALQIMLLTADTFERQAEWERFNGMADEFVTQRQRLEDLGLDGTQKERLQRGLSIIRRTQPLQAGLAQRTLNGDVRGAHHTLLSQDLPLERELLEVFDAMVEHERAATRRAWLEVEQADARAQQLLLLLGPLIVLGGLGIAVLVLRHNRRDEQALHREKELAEVTLHSIGDGVIRTDAEGAVRYLNPVAEQLTGWRTAEASGQPLGLVYHALEEAARQPADPLAAAPGVVRQDVILLGRHGVESLVEHTASPIHDHAGALQGYVVVLRDVTEARTLARQLSWQALHDPLTGLANRRQFEVTLEHALHSARAEHLPHALIYLDLDQFKIVNDTCGHAAGDELLRQFTALLRHEIRSSDTLARLGGDEFGVLLNNCPGPMAEHIAEVLRLAADSFRFGWDDKTFKVTGSIGLVHFSGNDGSVAELLIAADAACYQAKHGGRNRVVVYEAEGAETERQQREMQWAGRITRALEEDRFVLYMQPIRAVHAAPGSPPSSCELLLRLRDEQGGIVPPMNFLPAAERYGLMPGIDRWVVRAAFAWINSNGGRAHPVTNINLSAQSLCDALFLEFLLEELGRTGVPPALICFEITETAVITHWSQAGRFIGALRERGCRFALDDFGSGMASFGYLRNLPVDVVKIDGEFVRNIAHNAMDRATVEAINRVAQVAGMRTVAECVEDEAALAVLREIGVDFAQGYHIGRPAALPDRAAA